MACKRSARPPSRDTIWLARKLQLLAISFAGSTRPGGLPSNTRRTLAEAETRLSDIYALLQAGTSFESLVKTYSEDKSPGTYVWSREKRAELAPLIDSVLWRLQVGELGVAPLDPVDSPYGW